MTKIVWDQTGEKRYETGVDHGILYIPDNSGVYTIGYAWNGLTTITESPSGAEANPQYADNIKYINLISAEEFGGTIEAFTYPDAFEQCDGTAVVNGIKVGQQSRKSFGLAYRSLIGNDVLGTDYGYKWHLIYGATAAPSEKAYATVNDSPEAATLSWELSTTPTNVGTIGGVAYKPTSTLIIDSTKVSSVTLAALELILTGDTSVDPRLPSPAEVINMFETVVTSVNTSGANSPSYNSGTHVITLPAVTGIQWKIDGVNKTSGVQPALTVGQTKTVTAVPTAGYALAAGSDDDWVYAY